MPVTAWGQVYIQPTAPEEDPVQIGSLWSDTATGLLKVCTAVSPYTFATVSGGVGGSDTQVQFNDNGALAGDAGLTYNKTTDALTLAGLLDLSGAAAGQIKFPATQNASSNVNTLDDYEEGTWTPVFTCATTGNLSVSYSIQEGHYRKIGSQVTAWGRITTSSFTHTTASGAVKITGLPFTAGVFTSVNATGALAWQGITKANYTDANARVRTGESAFDVVMSGSGQTLVVLAVTDFPTGGTVDLIFTVFFLV